MEFQFPQYRKYKNGIVYFKILSLNEWEEIHIQKQGNTFHTFKAQILPDRNYLMDMLIHFEDYWNLSDEKEYETLKNRVLFN